MSKCDQASLVYLPLSLSLFREQTIFDHRGHSLNNLTDGVAEGYEQEDDQTTE